MNPIQNILLITDMYEYVRRRKELQKRLRIARLENRDNRRKYTMDINISILGYDIAMYKQHKEEFERGTWSSEQLTNVTSSYSGAVRHSHADILCIGDIQSEVALMMTIFMEPKANMPNAANRWQVRPFHAVNEAMWSDTAGVDRPVW